MAADLRLERSASGLTVRFPHLVGLSARKDLERSAGIEPASSAWKAEGPTPLKGRALCLALRLPVSMRRIVACAGLWAGVSGGLRALDPSLSVPVCPRPCAGGKANQNSMVLTRASNCPSNERDHDGLEQPAAAHVSSGFLIAVIMGARFVRASNSEVKRRITPGRDITRLQAKKRWRFRHFNGWIKTQQSQWLPRVPLPAAAAAARGSRLVALGPHGRRPGNSKWPLNSFGPIATTSFLTLAPAERTTTHLPSRFSRRSIQTNSPLLSFPSRSLFSETLP